MKGTRLQTRCPIYSVRKQDGTLTLEEEEEKRRRRREPRPNTLPGPVRAGEGGFHRSRCSGNDVSSRWELVDCLYIWELPGDHGSRTLGKMKAGVQ